MSEASPDGDRSRLVDEAAYVCPMCGEAIVIPIDVSEGRTQDYVEDCPVCCTPIHLVVHWRPDGTVDVCSDAE